MIALPLVSDRHWERVARDFDDVGPDACLAETIDELSAENPHYLAIARRCAGDTVRPANTLVGFAKFYRILAAEAGERGGGVPRITPQTLDLIDALLEEFGEAAFIGLATALMCEENPCLSQMADSFASRQPDYLTVMQGFALLYRCLSVQATTDRLTSIGADLPSRRDR